MQHPGGLRAEVWEDPICKLKAHSGGHGEDGEKVREEARDRAPKVRLETVFSLLLSL